MDAWVVVPALDEAATIARVVAGARAHAPVLVVDDGSTDATAALARAAGAEVVRHPRRLGKGQALRTGVTVVRARGARLVATLDGDGQHDPRDLPALLAVARAHPRTVVLGCRLSDAGALPPARLNAIRIASFFLRWVSGLAVEDSQCGFRVYPVALFEAVRPRRGGFVLETELLVAAAAAGFAVREVPVRAAPRGAARSRFRPIADGAAIGAYLAGRVLARWAVEARAAVAEVAAVFGRERRRLRHAELAAAVGAAGPGAWSATLATAVAERAAARVGRWWGHPRLRRALVAGRASLAAPGVLALTAAQALAGPGRPDLVGPLVRRLYAQRLLEEDRP